MKQTWIAIACVLAAASSVDAADRFAIVGRAACGTSTCHGGVIDRGPAWNHSLSTWVANDPHAGAGMLLRDADSRAIVERLDPAAADSPTAFDAVLRHRCISCHVTATAEMCASSAPLDETVLASGVSCESCHGAAEGWLEVHVRVDWRGPQRFGPETGMIDTESIVGRAETCIRCHIGSRTADGLTRDMNHDLIAAGHPALRFDLLLYNENLPKHWETKSEVESTFGASAIRLRSVGRAINLAAAAALSSERASAHLSDRSVPWPELADYDCFACHQSLSIREYQLPSRDKEKSPLHVSNGLPIWNAWHTINQLQLRDDPNLLKKLSPHRSDPKQIAISGRSLANTYRNLAVEQTSASHSVGEALEATRAQLQGKPPVDWHQAAIQYLEIDAAVRDLANDKTIGSRGKQLLEMLGGTEQLLRFDPSPPVVGQTSRYDSPTQFDNDAFHNSALEVITATMNALPPNGSDTPTQSRSATNQP